ncbi:serine hydrolase domain-containing protein [Tahibacter amnicola]|uniref:Serine hydrolase n=1 Tax=Tahibacter amnicola TaxID=2976241 RepID=A0ABY6BEG0_9GAMM|nr:serine hydrolase [Tahibacter amnicola]UXI68419.1 serine hydrolase [Tahibacter amnicola]
MCAITLAQLASQRSGLPPVPFNLFPSDTRDPYRDYTESDLLQFLQQFRAAADSDGGDSELASGLLGWALSRASEQMLSDALAGRVIGPLSLGATDTTDRELLPGFEGALAAVPQHFDGIAGAGALRSTAADMARLLQALLKPGDSPLRPALVMARQVRGDGASARGLGWRVQWVGADGQDWPVLWQQGRSGGHSVFVGFRVDRQQAVVLMGNQASSLAGIGLALLTDSAPPPLPPAPRSAPVPDDVSAYAGLYEFAAGQELVLRAVGSTLTAQTTGRLAVPLHPVEPDQFAYPQLPVLLTFTRDAGDRIESLRWTEGGVVVPVRRLSARAPRIARTARTLTAEALAPYRGDYQLDSNVLARVDVRDGVPGIQLTGTARRPLIAYADDRFATEDGELEVEAVRDASGRATRLHLHLLGGKVTLQRVEPVRAISGPVPEAAAPPTKPRPTRKSPGKDSAPAPPPPTGH